MRNHLPTLFIVLVSSLAACVGAPPPSTGGTGGGGGGTTTGGGGGGTTTGGGGGGTTGSDTGSDTGGGGDATAYLAGLASSDCTEAFMCKSSFVADGSGDTFADDFGTSVADCESGYWDVATVNADIAAGTITFNATDAAACIAGITPATTCALYWENGNTYPDSCDTATVGSVAVGGTCNTDLECSDADDYCDDTSSTCVAYPDGDVVRSQPLRAQLMLQMLRAR